MIVQPDIATHWKTRHLAVLLGGGEIGHLRAVAYLVRLWAHCQQSRRDRFPENATMLAGVCDSPMPPAELLAAMVAAGFVEIDEGDMVAHGWAELNAGLFASWGNGAKGGRPRKTQVEKKPMGYPWPPPQVTHGPPHGLTDKSREEKSRVEETREDSLSAPLPGMEDVAPATSAPPPRLSALERIAGEIYDEYPKKTGRAAAVKAIIKVLKAGKPPAELAASVRQFAAATEGADKQWLHKPAKWFGDGHYDDDPAEWSRMGRDSRPAQGGLAPGQVFHQKTHQIQLGPQPGDME